MVAHEEQIYSIRLPTPASTPGPSSSVESKTIHTSFNPQDPHNMRYPAQRDRDENDIWTERTRTDASKASRPCDLQGLEVEVWKRLST